MAFSNALDALKDMLGFGEEEEQTFDDIKGDIEFTGFSDDQQATILDQLERTWESESGRDMIEDGLSGNGLHYLNVNDQSVITSVGPSIGRTPDQVPGIGNFALPGAGEIYLNGYDALDAAGNVQTYAGLHPGLDGQNATAKAPITSLDVDGNVFTVPPIYTMIHETNHVARAEPDLPRSQPAGIDYDATMPTGTRQEVANAYAGQNEVSTRQILTEMGIDQQRGSYGATSLDGSSPGDAYGLGRGHDLSVTPSQQFDATGHAAADIVAVDGITQATLDAFGAPGRVDLLGTTFRMGNANDTVHALDGDDTVRTGGGDDAVYLGAGDDMAFAGRGNNVIDGGAANLDPASDHASDAATDWGFDTVSYTTLPDAFIPPQIDGTTLDGVVLSVSADAISVDKGIPFAPRIAGDTDALNKIDRVIGTDRADIAEVTGFADGTVLNGAGGRDRLDLSTMPDGELTHTPGTGTFQGVAYDGQIEHGGSTLYYSGFERIDLPDAGEDATSGTDPAEAAKESATVPLSLLDAARILETTHQDAAREADVSDDVRDQATGSMLRGGGAEAMLSTLHHDGETTIEVDRELLAGGPLSQARGVVEGASTRVVERGLEEAAETAQSEIAASRPEDAATAAEMGIGQPQPHLHGHDQGHGHDHAHSHEKADDFAYDL